MPCSCSATYTASSISAIQDNSHTSPKGKPESLKGFCISSIFSFPLCSTLVQTIFHALGLDPPAPSLQSFSKCQLLSHAPQEGAQGGASDTAWQRWWRQGHETGALTTELKLSLSGMMQLLVCVEPKGTSTPCSSSMRTRTLWNKLQVQTKPREEEQVQLSRDSTHRGTWSTCGSAPKAKGSRLWEIKHHALIYPLLAGHQPSPGAATHLFHLVE